MAQAATFVSDTHTLVWFLTADKKLSDAAEEIMDSHRIGGATVYIPTIVLAEFLSMARRGRVPWEHFLTLLVNLRSGGSFAIANLDFEVLARMVDLATDVSSPKKLDLHDLAILGTAASLGATLITKDPKLREQDTVTTIW